MINSLDVLVFFIITPNTNRLPQARNFEDVIAIENQKNDAQ
jgi:hypothetical protein